MLDKPHAAVAPPALRGAQGKIRLPAKIMLSLTEAVRDRLKAEADRTQSTVSTVARQRILRSLAEDDRRANDAKAA